jgi:hypothetical protein
VADKPNTLPYRQMRDNCPIREHTADGISVGRCFYYLTPGPAGEHVMCPRHGDVSAARQRFINTGELTNG